MLSIHKYLCITALALSFFNNYSNDTYKKELNALKENPAFAGIFDENISPSLNDIQRDIQTYAHTTFSQRLLLYIFFLFDSFVVTPETMPLLYNYVDGICKNQNIKTPVIFVSRKESFFNAFASKLLLSCGGILIGQKVILESSDAALEGVIAHELGHIKYNHVNKGITLALLVYALFPHKFCDQFFSKYTYTIPLNTHGIGLQIGAAPFMGYLLRSWIVNAIINKRFEKEADAFAYQTIGKGDGLIEFFELLEKKEDLYEQGFVDSYAILQANKNKVGFINYLSLARRYYIERAFNYIDRAFHWLYHNTFLGAHPNHEARIAAIREYQQGLESSQSSSDVLPIA